MHQSVSNLLFVTAMASLLLIPTAALAGVLVKVDAKPKTSISVLLDPLDGNTTVEGSPSSPVVASRAFALSDKTLFRDRKKVDEAVQLLAQGRSGDVDIVVYRTEYNSWANPLRVIAGHPKQVSRVYVRAYRGDKLLWTRLLFKGAYTHGWEASIDGREDG